jgi:hypothetical protein
MRKSTMLRRLLVTAVLGLAVAFSGILSLLRMRLKPITWFHRQRSLLVILDEGNAKGP